MFNRYRVPTVFALVTILLTSQAPANGTDADVFGLTVKSGFGSGHIKVIDLGDGIYFSTGRACTALLVPQPSGGSKYDLLIDKRNARACKKIKSVRLGDREGDILSVGIEGKRKTKTYQLRRLATQREAVILPPALADIRGLSLAMNDEEIRAAFDEMPGTVQMGRTSRNWGSRSGLVVYSEPKRNATEQILVLGAGSAPGPAAIRRHWEPRGDEQPDRDTLIAALEDKYGKPSLRETNRKVEFMQWHYDSAGAKLDGKAALDCSSLSPKKSKAVFSRSLKAPTPATRSCRKDGFGLCSL